MKVWIGYGSEHSANLVIIGQFASPDDAETSLRLLNEATSIARADEKAGRLKAGDVSSKLTDAQMELFRRSNIALGSNEFEALLYEFHAKRQGPEVVITTEESEINVFLKVLLHNGAKIQVYSAHDHASPYGRQTAR